MPSTSVAARQRAWARCAPFYPASRKRRLSIQEQIARERDRARRAANIKKKK